MRLPNYSQDHSDDNNEVYDLAFFKDHLKHQEAFQELANLIFALLLDGRQIRNIDIGCGHGLLVEAFRNCGLRESFGLEGSASAEALWPSSHRSYYQIADLRDTAIFQSLPVTEMVTTFETAEHLPEQYANQFVQLLVHHQPKLVLFGAATWLQDQGQNPTHYNEQPYHYWINKFKQLGYNLDIRATIFLRNQLFQRPVFSGTWWYPKNILIFSPCSLLPQQKIHRSIDQSILSQGINWFNINGNEDMFSLMLLRDYCEYKLLILEYLSQSTKQVK